MLTMPADILQSPSSCEENPCMQSAGGQSQPPLFIYSSGSIYEVELKTPPIPVPKAELMQEQPSAQCLVSTDHPSS